jgi:PAS domain S-box-containing protein
MNEIEKYHKLIEATGTGFVILDDKGLVLDANQTYVNLTGRQTFEEIRGHSIDEWTAPYEKERNLAAVKQCFEQGFIQHLEIDYIDPSGKITPVEIEATVAQTDIGAQILSLARDITERKRAEEETRLRFEVSQVLAGKETEDEVLDALIQQTGLYPQAQVMIFTSELVEGETYSVARRIESFDSELAALVEPGARFSASQSQMIEKSKSSAGDEFVSPNLPADERADPFFRDLARQMGTVSMAIVPIKIGNNLLGSISLSSRAEGYFDTPKLRLYRSLAEQGARALQAAQLRDQVRANEDKYRKLIETTDTGFVIIDGQGNVLDANQNYVKLDTTGKAGGLRCEPLKAVIIVNLCPNVRLSQTYAVGLSDDPLPLAA